MPTYKFEHKKTGEKFNLICKHEEIEDTLKENVFDPNDWQRIFNITLSTSGGKTHINSRTDEGWKDRLRSIKRANPGSTINI